MNEGHEVATEAGLVEAAPDSAPDSQTDWEHLDRLAKLGRLVTGIVHELNQPAAYVMVAHGAMQRSIDALSRELAKLDDPALGALLPHLKTLSGHVRDSMTGMEQLREMVRTVRDFARPSASAELVDVNQVVTAACAITRHELCACSEVLLALAAVPSVTCEPVRLTQVIVNLLLNAVQAIATRPGAARRIRIATRTESGQVLIEVEDDGCGVPEAIRSRIFEPFFSTKPDQGTGIGLWLSAAIVQGLGGEIEVESEPSRGSLFRVRLPPSAAGGH
jgi:two-component system, NtrC family, sensor kinase